MALQFFSDISKKAVLEDGTTYAYIFTSSETAKPTLLLLHGFPSASFDWRRIIPLLQKVGYGIIAPDLLGYGDTDKPTDLPAYAMGRIANHLREIVAKENVSQVVGVGHDFGSILLSHAALAFPSLFSGLVFTSVGYTPPAPFDVDQINALTESILGYPVFGYWKFHGEADAASIIEAHGESFTSLWYPPNPSDWREHLAPLGAAKQYLTSNKMTPLPTWLNDVDVQERNQIFKKAGYTAPLKWYKAAMSSVNDESAAAFQTEESKKIQVPALLILGTEDPVCVADLQKHTTGYLENHRIEILECGHWIPLEKPAEFTSLLLEFAQSLNAV